MPRLTVKATICEAKEKVWQYWTTPGHICRWNHASDDWHTPAAANDLRVGGRFTSRMEARDGSVGFDFSGIYQDVQPGQLIRYTIDDGRSVEVLFRTVDGGTEVIETFDAETENSAELQQQGWQAILNNFKRYTEWQAG